MSLVVAIDEVEADQRRNNPRSKPGSAHIDFIKSSKDTPNSPAAYLVEHAPGRWSSAHYHAQDQFQIVVDGNGKLGRHDLAPYVVHFARAYTPYGPLVSDPASGWGFITLRTRYDPGAQHLPAAHEKLRQIPDRRPWQISKKVNFPSPGGGVSLQRIPGIKDDQGLYACALSMAPSTTMIAPDPGGGDGQFVLVVKGSLLHEDRERKALAIVFVKSEERAFEIHAGPQGLEGLILNFPKAGSHAMEAVLSTAAGFRRWQCALCAFAYDEALGLPDEGIPAGTRWEDVPETWTCPDCSAGKSDFEMVLV